MDQRRALRHRNAGINRRPQQLLDLSMDKIRLQVQNQTGSSSLANGEGSTPYRFE